MRGDLHSQNGLFSYLSPEARVPATPPLRRITVMADTVLEELSPIFDAM